MADPPPRSSGTPSPDLLRAVRDGEAAAVDAWFRAEHTVVFRLCFGFLADGEEAEDAAQDAMLHLLDNLHAWDSRRPYRTWRNTVVRNLCRDRHRRREARRRAEDSAAERRGDVLPDPTDDIVRGEVREVLRESLAALSPREREVFVLRDLEGMPTAEVAASLSITAGTVRSLSTLARRRLRGLLGARLDPAEGGGRA